MLTSMFHISHCLFQFIQVGFGLVLSETQVRAYQHGSMVRCLQQTQAGTTDNQTGLV